MIKMLVTKAYISKGYESAPALKFSENADNPFVRFRIGIRVYDKKAEGEHRFVNINVKAFGKNVERISKMKLDAGMVVNIQGHYDVETWEDRETKAQRSEPVLIVEEIEYGDSNGNGKQNGGNATNSNGAPAGPPAQTPPAAEAKAPDAFTGYVPFGGPNPYFPDDNTGNQ